MPITLSDKARTELSSLLNQQGKKGALLRVWVAGVGCSGFRYGMGIDEKEPEEGDRIFESDGVKVIVDAESMKYLDGSSIDFVDDPETGGFSIDNPNPVPQTSCNCGSGGCGSGVPADAAAGESSGGAGAGSAGPHEPRG